MKKLLINHFISLSIKGFAVVGSFLLAKVYIDKISTEEFGLFTLNYGYVVLFATFIGTGPGLLVIARIKAEKSSNPFLFFLINSIITIVLWFVVRLFFQFNIYLLYTIIITGLCYYINETMRLNSSGNVYILQKDIIRTIACVVLIFLNIKSADDILFYSSIINFFSIIAYGIAFKKEMKVSFNSTYISKNDYMDSLSISISSGLQIVRGWIEVYLSGIFLSLKEVGLFSVLQKLAKLISLPINALNADIAKKVAVSIQEEKIDNKLKHQLLLMRITSIIFSLVCFISLGYFLKIYNYDSSILNIIVGGVLILTNLANALFGPVGLFTQLSKLHHFFLISTILSIIITAILSWIFLPLYGILALSIINLITMVLWNGSLYFKIMKATNIKL
ncbi:MAG: hypothetical protein KDC60_07870 [Bacteroidetes bacterium]|nr:hypothetical protein [Bacteroidota bacterium]